MEWSESNKSPSPERTRFRYAVGVVAPAVAWPSIMMPIEYALITQFAAFTGLYFVDAKAASRGWAPAWYGTYRFVLTFIVGTAIVLSLVGRASLGEKDHKLTKSAIRERLHPTKPDEDKANWARLEQEEKQKNAEKQAEKEKAEKEAKETEKKKRSKSDKKDQKGGDKKDKKQDDKKSSGKDEKEEDGGDSDEGEDDTKNGDGEDDSKKEDKDGDEEPDEKSDGQDKDEKGDDGKSNDEGGKSDKDKGKKSKK